MERVHAVVLRLFVPRLLRTAAATSCRDSPAALLLGLERAQFFALGIQVLARRGESLLGRRNRILLLAQGTALSETSANCANSTSGAWPCGPGWSFVEVSFQQS